MNAAVGADERLVVMLEARISEFEKRMRQAEQRGTRTYQGLSRNSRSATRQMEADMIRSSTAINRALASTSSKIGTFGKAAAGGFVAGAAATVFASITTDIAGTVKGIASLSDEAKRAGLGLRAFQEWKFVAEQNRIGVDAMVDGFKELSLRADEFIVTGAGPAAESFKRLGYSAASLKKQLADPSELMKTLIERMKGLDKAAQIRVADEIFGGTAGERFVELLGQGRAGIEATIDRAHEAGAVLDEEMVAKAAELDPRFNELQATVGNFFKRVSVSAAEAVVELTDLRARLDDLFDNPDQGKSRLGEDLYDALDQNRDAVEASEQDIARLNQAYQTLAEGARKAGMDMASSAGLMASWGYDEASDQLARASEEIRRLADEFGAGTISGDDFALKLDEVRGQAEQAYGALDDVDRVHFSGAISEIVRLGNVISGAISLANSLRQAIAAAAGTGGTVSATTTALRQRHEAEAASMEVMRSQAEASEKFLAAEEAQNAKTAERLQLEREIESVRRRAADSGAYLTEAELEAQAGRNLAAEAARKPSGAARGGGRSKGGGGSSRQSDFQREIDSTRERIALWETEAAAMVAAAASGQEYGDALDFARKRAELLHAAQQDGKTITPELSAEIDKLAEAYMTAGMEAEDAADRLDRIKEQSEAGKGALEDIFGAVLEGADSAKQAVARLLMEIAKIQLMKGIMSLPGMGAISGAIGRALIPGFASGGDHRGGLRIVGERGPELEATGPSRIWNADQTRNLLAGRPTGAGSGAAMQAGGTTTIRLDLSPDLEARVLDKASEQSVQITRQSVAAYDRQMPSRMQQISAQPRRR